MLIDANAVVETLKQCLFTQEEINAAPNGVPLNVVWVQGVQMQFGLHPERLESTREQVQQWVHALPEQFNAGWSFLQMCVDREGTHWGEHRNMEALLVLAIGLKLMKYCAPKEVWPLLPGGVPYVQTEN